MYRITQSFLTNNLASQLKIEGWNIMYVDFADGRRGGNGSQGLINKCLEDIFDEFPDIIASKNGTLLIIEVDIGVKKEYIEKLKRFALRRDELFSCIEVSTRIKHSKIITGLAFSRRTKLKEIIGHEMWAFDLHTNVFKKEL